MSVVLNEIELEFSYKSEYGVFVNESNPSVFLPVAGKKYRIVWDGDEYIEAAMTHENFPGQVLMGNQLLAGGENTEQPFAIASIENGDGMTIFALDTKESHRLAVYLVEEEQPEEPTETTGVTIVLYDRTGAAVTYEGVETLTTDTPVEGEYATFTHGELLTGTEIELDMSAGDQKVSVPDGYLVKEATLKKPETMIPEHIKRGVDIGGVVGTFAGDETEKIVDLDMSAGDQVIEADADTVMKKVTVRKPETLLPENIADGVNIAGVVGSFKAVQAPHQLIDGTGEAFEIIDESFDIPPTAVKSSAFYKNDGITKVVMSEVREIGASAFGSCSKLAEVSFEKCEVIGAAAFDRCFALTSAYFPECKEIQSSAFQWCSTIEKLEFPNLVSCANYAFGSCSALAEVNIEKMTRLPTGMFDNCPKLSNIVFADEISDFGMYAIRGTAYYSNVAERVSNVLYVKNVAVSGLSTTGISGVLTFRDGTTCVGGDGFYACSKITGISCEGMKWIGGSAFRSCSYITSISMPEVVQIGASAFMNCYRLKSAIFPKCTELGSYAFQYCSVLSVVEIPLCESIGYSTFQNCSMLASIDFPNCLSVGMNAFINCSALTEAEFPVCTMVGISAFCSCIKLSVANFQECSFVQSNAFNSCKALTAISFPKCTTVGSSAFKACSALIEAVFPMCKFVSSCAFQACSLLKTVDLGVCSQIAYSAFWACSALEKIILRSTAVCNLTSSSAFYATKIYSKTGKIYVPSSLVASYKAATNWKYFSTIISAIESMEV